MRAPNLVLFSTLLTVVASGILSWHCKRLDPTPPPMVIVDSTLEVPPSHYNISVRLDVRRFEDWLNQKITGTFFEREFKVREDRDSLILKITKTGRIGVSLSTDRMTFDFPLHLEGYYFRKLLGDLKISNKQPIEADIRLRLSTIPSLAGNWHVKSNTQAIDIVWLNDPFVKLGPVQINLKKALTRLFEERKGELADLLDEKIYERVTLEKAITRVWRGIQKPIPIYKKDPPYWLKFHCEKVFGRTRLQPPHDILFDVHIEAGSLAAADTNVFRPANLQLPRLEPYDHEGRGLNLYVHASLPFERINAVLNRELRGKKIEKQGVKVVIRRVTVYGTPEGVAVNLQVRGDVRGNLYLGGKLAFNPEEGLIRIDSFDYDLRTEDLLVSYAAQLLREDILLAVKPYLSLEVKQELQQLPQFITQAVEAGRPGEAIDLRIDTLVARDWVFLPTRSDLQFLLHFGGKADIELEKIKTGKRVKIQ